LIERDLSKPQPELVAKFKDASPTPKTKPEQKLGQKDKAAPPKPEKTWLEKYEEAERKSVAGGFGAWQATRRRRR